MSWQCDESTCAGIFTKVDVALSDMKTAHGNASASIDTAGAVFSDSKVADIALALNAAWNIALAPAMANCEAQVANVTTNGRNAVTALHNFQQDAAEGFEQAAATADQHARVGDGKKVK